MKPEVREIARKAGLPTAAKKDSQGICFLGDVSIQDFLKQYIPEKRGALVTTAGEHIGEHQGAEFYTIGQRHLGVSYRVTSDMKRTTRKKNDTGRFYVASKDAKTNTVTVAEGSENPALLRKEIMLTDVHFINSSFANSIELANEGIEVFVRVRYRQPLVKATLIEEGGARKKEEGLKNNETSRLVFDLPQKFIAPGQSAVFYSKKGEMLGGGVIL